jgi:hypothetical protein
MLSINDAFVKQVLQSLESSAVAPHDALAGTSGG